MTRQGIENEPIKVLDLFAGCGGLTEGFHQFRRTDMDGPQFQSVGAVEWDAAAAATYAMNFGAQSHRTNAFAPPEIYRDDITTWVPRWSPGEIDVVVGGPPCQGFSGLNRKKVGAERNQLWEHFIRVVVAVRPKVFVIENVDRFVRSPEFADLKRRMGSGDLQDYELVAPPGAKDGDSEAQRARRYLLNAADYGAPQARRRAIVIGVRNDGSSSPELMQYPERTHAKDAGQEAWRTVDDLFRRTARTETAGTDLPERPCRVELFDKVYEGQGPYTTGELHITRSPERLSIARYKAIPRGGNRKNLRGRYLCRFKDDDGGDLIIEKCGQYRSCEGELAVPGKYSIVHDGHATGDHLRIHLDLSTGASRMSGGKGRSEEFDVAVQSGGRERSAVIEYLSTPAWDRHDAGSGDVMGRLRAGGPSVTIRTEFFKPEKGRYLHPTQDRPITHYEAAVLQGFPESFKWCGSKTEIARQIGNAVPIPLGERIASAIYEYLRPVRATVSRSVTRVKEPLRVGDAQ
ncbi:DNA cytosine methyltransferase [Isoptericola sp. 178]|uniref:DNA cytosine methyltransferase n=1 Tax=Isoptericola sp. 178 TaxID=3064651 RepID=UPI002712C91D|nr:DNA cytosine methyltransferase [Isoptericola sp. 178]MDO8143619.1 DNA cytosine methyltransferase [Isoptericola sp. 178]